MLFYLTSLAFSIAINILFNIVFNTILIIFSCYYLKGSSYPKVASCISIVVLINDLCS